MLEVIIKEELGFTEDEMDAIYDHFTCTLDFEDWETIQFIEEDDEDLEDIEDLNEHDNFLKLPTGRIVYFPDELMRKEVLAQID